MDRYPTMEEGLKVLVDAPTGSQGKWRGPYINLLRADPWDHPYEYRVPGTHHPSRFDIWSRGPDTGEAQGKEIGNW
jgi:general secretion pathway protein G